MHVPSAASKCCKLKTITVKDRTGKTTTRPVFYCYQIVSAGYSLPESYALKFSASEFRFCTLYCTSVSSVMSFACRAAIACSGVIPEAR